MNSAARLLLVAAGVLLGAVGFAPSAAAEGEGRLRFAHLSPDTPAVDVALRPLRGAGSVTDPGPDVATDLGYGEVSGFTGLAPGSYAVSVRAAGSPSTTPPVLTTRVEVAEGGAATVAVTGAFDDVDVRVLPDDLSPAPPGAARVRVVAAAAGAETLDVAVLGGAVLADDLAFPDAGAPVAVPAGPATLRLADGTAELPVEFAAGSVVTVVVLDRTDGGLTARIVLDAAGPARVPVGAVAAGGGPGHPVVPALTGLAGLLALRSARGRVLVTVVATGAALATLPAAPAAARGTVAAPVLETLTASAAPARLTLPSVGVDTALTGIGLTGAGVLVPPEDPAVAGWYTGSAAPGDPGPAVLAGHVDWAGAPGVFARLDELAVGDPVLVRGTDGTTRRFTVTRVERHPKAAFPTDAVYGTTPDAELRLITCGGAFDRARGSYTDNVVVFARAG